MSFGRPCARLRVGGPVPYKEGRVDMEDQFATPYMLAFLKKPKIPSIKLVP